MASPMEMTPSDAAAAAAAAAGSTSWALDANEDVTAWKEDVIVVDD